MIVALLGILALAAVALLATSGYAIIFCVRSEEERLREVIDAARQLQRERAAQLAAAKRYVRHWRPKP